MSDQSKDVQAIAQRIEALERQNRWLIRAGLIGSLLVVLALTMGQARPSRTLEAERFVLKDTRGRMRGQLLVDDSGPTFRLFDSNEESQMVIGMAPKIGSYLILGDPVSKASAELLAGDNSGPALLLHDSNGTIQAALKVQSESGPDLSLFNPSDKAYFKASSGKIELGVPPKTYMLLNTHVGPGPLDSLRVLLRDEAGYSAILGSVRLDTGQAGESRTTSAASLKLFDKNNRVIWSAP